MTRMRPKFLPLVNFFTVTLILVVNLWPFILGAAQTQTPPLPEAKSIQNEYNPFAPAYQSCGGTIAPLVNWAYEQEVVELTNQARAANDLPPLKRVDELDQAARYHATDLGLDDYFDHDSYDRIDCELNFVCLWWARINTFYPGVQAENIAAGYPSPSAVVQAWLDSPGHRQNILSTYHDEIGVGYFQGEGQYNTYWTQDFGNRGGIYPLVINGEAAETAESKVSLYIYGEWHEVRLRNNEDAWSEWQPFVNELEWSLPPTNGEHRVTAEMRDETWTTTSSDTILLTSQSTEPQLGNLPAVITFTYSLAGEEYFPSVSVQTPANIGSNEDLVWEVEAKGDWFSVTPLSGATPDAFSISPTQIITSTSITYTGVVTVTAWSPMGILCTPAVTQLHIQFTEDTISRVHLPLLGKPAP
jgi:uncharacterized protein YkwD